MTSYCSCPNIDARIMKSDQNLKSPKNYTLPRYPHYATKSQTNCVGFKFLSILFNILWANRFSKTTILCYIDENGSEKIKCNFIFFVKNTVNKWVKSIFIYFCYVNNCQKNITLNKWKQNHRLRIINNYETVDYRVQQ